MTPIETKHRGTRSRYDTAIFEKKVLSNGIAVWIQKSPVLLTEEGVITANFVKVGNVLDPVGKEGLAHFLEHMPFKGTEKYPSNQVLTGEIRGHGGGFNATTSRYWTKYFIALPGSEFPLALEVLGELLLKPLMKEEDFQIERGVIESERQRKFEHGATLASHDADELLFGNHPAMSWGIGSATSIAGITLDDVKEFWSQYYHAGNLQLSIGGTFSEIPNLMEQLEQVFGSMEKKDPVELKLPVLSVPDPRRSKIVDPRYGRDRFFLEWIVPGEPSEASLDALDLLTAAYSGGMDSPLAMELRDKRGLVYESGLMSGGRVSTIATRVTLELPVTASQYEDISTVVMELLRDLSDERIAAVLDRWQQGRLMGFHYPTNQAVNVAGELVNRGEPRSVHDDEAERDDTDLELVHWWRNFPTTTPPAIVESTAKSEPTS